MILGSFGVYKRCIIEWCSSFRALRYLKITIAPLSWRLGALSVSGVCSTPRFSWASVVRTRRGRACYYS